MTVNEKIEQALTKYVGEGRIWPMVCPDQNQPEKYIVYNPETETTALRADDCAQEWADYMQIHYFQKGNANVLRLKRQIADDLEAVDFSVTEIQTDYEKDTGYTHVTFSCNIAED